jgi:hypothetical protein
MKSVTEAESTCATRQFKWHWSHDLAHFTLLTGVPAVSGHPEGGALKLLAELEWARVNGRCLLK